MSGLYVLVVDDEPLARRRLIRLLEKLEWVGQIGEASNAIEAKSKIEGLTPDILLLDIQMPGGSGFELLEKLEVPPPVTVFITAFDHYALRAFEKRAVDYLTKPIDAGRFEVAMARAQSASIARDQADRIAELQEVIASLKLALKPQSHQKTEFWVKYLGEYIRVPQDSILRFQAERDYVRIHILGATYLYHETLSSLEQRLDGDDFIRIHRSCIVNRQSIVRIKKTAFSSFVLVLSDGSESKVGRTYSNSVWEKLKRV